MPQDPRRNIPATDHLLVVAAAHAPELDTHRAKALIHDVQARARSGHFYAGDVEAVVIREAKQVAGQPASSMRSVLNATGVVVHTNLGRAPLSAAAVGAVTDAAGYVDVELDLKTGHRAPRGAGAKAALLRQCPAAEDALIVNNGAAALLLVITALAAGSEVIVSRGELVEIGGGFRLPELLVSTGARLREVGTTNRTHTHDYAGALSPETGCVLKVHPSNFWVEGFTTSVEVEELAKLLGEVGDSAGRNSASRRPPLIADLGSGLLHPEPRLPAEPDVTTALVDGADLVIISGDKLLGGPQAGIILGKRDLIEQLSAHPLTRAVRADKLTYAALEATLDGDTPVARSLNADPARLLERAEALAGQVGGEVVAHDGRVGGGGAPGIPLPGWAVQLPEEVAPRLRAGEPVVVARIHKGHCLLDLRCIPESDDLAFTEAVQTALSREPKAHKPEFAVDDE